MRKSNEKEKENSEYNYILETRHTGACHRYLYILDDHPTSLRYSLIEIIFYSSYLSLNLTVKKRIIVVNELYYRYAFWM